MERPVQDMFSTKRKAVVWLLALVLLAIVFRGGRCLVVNRIEKDAPLYIKMAEKAAAGDPAAWGLLPRVPPAYIATMAFGERIGIGAAATGLLVSVLAGSLLLIPVFFITKALFDTKIALAAALLTAVHPYLARMSVETIRDNLFLLFFFSALAFAVTAVAGEKSRLWLPAGACAGLATLTRSEGIELVLALPLWFAIELWLTDDGKKRMLRGQTVSLLAFAAAFMLVTVPVQYALMDTGSSWTVIDPRIDSFLHDFLFMPSREIITAGRH